VDKLIGFDKPVANTFGRSKLLVITHASTFVDNWETWKIVEQVNVAERDN